MKKHARLLNAVRKSWLNTMLKQLRSTLNWRGLISILGFFLSWYLACIFELPGFAEMANPAEVIQMFVNEYAHDGHYWLSWVTSFQRVLYGFLFAQLLGIPLGLFFGTSDRFRELFFPVFELLRPIPPLAWVPMSILFWPTNESSIIFITFIIVMTLDYSWHPWQSLYV